LGRVPITVLGYRCERCQHEWIPRREGQTEPRVCPKCKSPYWGSPRQRSAMTYEEFQKRIRDVLATAEGPLTWTEIRTAAKLPQMFPNNQWVRRLGDDIALRRERDKHGIIHWQLSDVPAKHAKRS
jgi:hypothetical protein